MEKRFSQTVTFRGSSLAETLPASRARWAKSVPAFFSSSVAFSLVRYASAMERYI